MPKNLDRMARSIKSQQRSLLALARPPSDLPPFEAVLRYAASGSSHVKKDDLVRALKEAFNNEEGDVMTTPIGNHPTILFIQSSPGISIIRPPTFTATANIGKVVVNRI